jgi:hypothetical protein
MLKQAKSREQIKGQRKMRALKLQLQSSAQQLVKVDARPHEGPGDLNAAAPAVRALTRSVARGATDLQKNTSSAIVQLLQANTMRNSRLHTANKCSKQCANLTPDRKTRTNLSFWRQKSRR